MAVGKVSSLNSSDNSIVNNIIAKKELTSQVMKFLPHGELLQFSYISQAALNIFRTTDSSHLQRIEEVKKNIQIKPISTLNNAIHCNDSFVENAVIQHSINMQDDLENFNSKKLALLRKIGIIYLQKETPDIQIAMAIMVFMPQCFDR